MPYASSLARLQSILAMLRQQCPWDKKQTIHSLRQLTIEETYELADAISESNWDGLKEELGDLLLHLLFYARIAEEEGKFGWDDVVAAISAKLVKRHPHIYGNVAVQSDEDVKQNWEKIKLKEGKKSILSGVPKSLPALVKALRLQEKTKTVGFEWNHIDQVRQKVDEEIGELYEAVALGVQKDIEEELGDALFALINYARFAGVDPEHALEQTNKKFIRRFQAVEAAAATKPGDITAMSLEEMDMLWEAVKKAERTTGNKGEQHG